MRALSSIALLSCTLAAAGARAQAPKPAAERVLIYVDEIGVEDKALAQDAQALTTSLCAALAKDKRLDVMCAPDVRQILSFAATSAMIGTGAISANAVEVRLEKVRHVVQGSLRRDAAKNVVLVLKGGPRADGSTTAALFTEKPVIALEEKADKPQKLLDRLPTAAQKLGGALLAPPAPAPPAPLSPAPK
jgi:hypothetical protein